MSEEIITSGNIKIENFKFYRYNNHIYIKKDFP